MSNNKNQPEPTAASKTPDAVAPSNIWTGEHGIFRGAKHVRFTANVGSTTEIESGRSKGTKITPLADAVVELRNGRPVIGFRVMLEKLVNGKTIFALRWPALGNGVFTRQAFPDVRATRDYTPDPKANEDAEAFSKEVIAEFERWALAEKNAGRPLVKKAVTDANKRAETSVEANPELLAGIMG